MLVHEDIEGTARGRRTHDLKRDGFGGKRCNQRGVGQQHLSARAEQNDFRFEFDRVGKLVHCEFTRIDDGPVFDDLIRCNDQVAADPLGANEQATAFPGVDQMIIAAIARELQVSLPFIG